MHLRILLLLLKLTYHGMGKLQEDFATVLQEPVSQTNSSTFFQEEVVWVFFKCTFYFYSQRDVYLLSTSA